MGFSIIKTYVGAYFKVNMSAEELREKLKEINFDNVYRKDNRFGAKYEHFNFTNFECPYQGLEDMPILLPFEKDENKPVCISIEYEDEVEIELKTIDFNVMVQNLRETYHYEIIEMIEVFGDALQVTSGVVCYRDEIG